MSSLKQIYGVVALFLVASGCTLLQKNLLLLKEERPVTLFNRYKLDIEAQSYDTSSIYWLMVDVNFVDKHSADVRSVDSIPILILDSVCFGGGCVKDDTCRLLFMYGDEYSIDSQRVESEKQKAAGIFVDTTGVPPGTYDLFESSGRIVPHGFYVSRGMALPEACVDSSGVMRLYSRLIDRATNELISEKALEVRFEVTTRKVWYNRPH